MKLKTFFVLAGLGIGLFGLAACGGAVERTYQYHETTALFNDFHIKKTVYRPGVMKLYYRGGQFKDTPIRCYDANFEELGDAEHLQEIVLENSDHAAADLHVLYDTQNEVILGSGLTYHRE